MSSSLRLSIERRVQIVGCVRSGVISIVGLWNMGKCITIQPSAMDADYVSGVVVRNPRILVSEMVRHIDPRTTARMKASIQFEFTDKNICFLIKINKGTCTLEETRTQKWDLKITVSSDVWAQIFLREINALSALREKQVIVEGDKTLFTRLDKYFPLPFD